MQFDGKMTFIYIMDITKKHEAVHVILPEAVDLDFAQIEPQLGHLILDGISTVAVWSGNNLLTT